MSNRESTTPSEETLNTQTREQLCERCQGEMGSRVVEMTTLQSPGMELSARKPLMRGITRARHTASTTRGITKKSSAKRGMQRLRAETVTERNNLERAIQIGSPVVEQRVNVTPISICELENEISVEAEVSMLAAREAIRSIIIDKELDVEPGGYVRLGPLVDRSAP